MPVPFPLSCGRGEVRVTYATEKSARKIWFLGHPGRVPHYRCALLLSALLPCFQLVPCFRLPSSTVPRRTSRESNNAPKLLLTVVEDECAPALSRPMSHPNYAPICVYLRGPASPCDAESSAVVRNERSQTPSATPPAHKRRLPSVSEIGALDSRGDNVTRQPISVRPLSA